MYATVLASALTTAGTGQQLHTDPAQQLHDNGQQYCQLNAHTTSAAGLPDRSAQPTHAAHQPALWVSYAELGCDDLTSQMTTTPALQATSWGWHPGRTVSVKSAVLHLAMFSGSYAAGWGFMARSAALEGLQGQPCAKFILQKVVHRM